MLYCLKFLTDIKINSAVTILVTEISTPAFLDPATSSLRKGEEEAAEEPGGLAVKVEARQNVFQGG